jgi:hypothetical protein
MADFTTVTLDCNIQSTATPTFQSLTAFAQSGAPSTGVEVRWSGTGTGLRSTGSTSWPADIRPASTGIVAFTYVFTADTTGFGFYGGSGTSADPVTWANTSYKWAKWHWDNTGTFASAPIITAYDTSGDTTATSGLLGGSSGDTSSKSYLKINAYGANVATVPVPAAAPTNAPVVTDGTAGALTYSSAGAWLTNYQDARGDTDYIQYGATPTAATAQDWYMIFALFNGPNMTPSTYVFMLALKYSWT